MLAFLALLPAYALDLEVTYSAQPAGYVRSWTFHDVDLEAPPVVMVPCPGGEECRMAIVVEEQEGGAVAVRLDLQGEPVRKRSRYWVRPSITLQVGEEGSCTVGEVGSTGRSMTFRVLPFEPEVEGRAPEPE